MSIVNTNIPYNSAILKQNLTSLIMNFPFLNIQTVGRSIMNNDIWVIKLGNGPKQVFYSASIHANEWITTTLLMRFIEDYSNAYVSNSKLFGYSIRNLFKTTSIFIMPMVNPDGVDLVTTTIPTNSPSYKMAKEISANFPSIPFPSGWKANIRGVDLNLNYPAGWKQAVKNKLKKGIDEPGPRDYPGPNAVSEIETKNMINFTKLFNFDMTISLHSQGKEIYWSYLNKKILKAYEIGKKMERVSGYKLCEPSFYSSFAGYKDWFIDKFNKPGYTIEIGKGEECKSLPLEKAIEIYNEVEEILLVAIEEC